MIIIPLQSTLVARVFSLGGKMKQKLIYTFLFMTALLACLILVRESRNLQPSLEVEKIKDELSQESSTESLKHPIIEELNQKNQAIKSFFCQDMEVKIWDSGHRVRLQGKISYLKAKNFRMEIASVFGKELDLGANDTEFWYWSRRDRRPGLYWASYTDFNKTRLKTPFNPMFMKSTLGLDTLDISDAKISENTTSLMVTYPRKDSMGRQILYSVFINKTRKEIDGFLITSSDGVNLVECQIETTFNGLPTKINYKWHEEDRTMSIIMKRPKVNVEIPPSSYVMPNYTPKINMADE